MKKIEKNKLEQFSERLKTETQESVMKDIEQFSEAEISGKIRAEDDTDINLCPIVFNMERGMTFAAEMDFLKECPQIQPYNLILANELDFYCARSGNVDVAEEAAKALGMKYVYGLEFIELKDKDLGFHGNAIFSKFPIDWAEILRLPEQYNWYYDRQKRIGGRNAVFARINYNGTSVGVVSVHLENRTDPEGRRKQMRAVLDEAERVFEKLPIIIGGDLNTNTFDGCDKKEIVRLAENPEELNLRIKDVECFEPLLADCESKGYEWRLGLADNCETRRKDLPDGSYMSLRLDYIITRGFSVKQSAVVSTLREDCEFASKGSALEKFSDRQLSDHNVVWASLTLKTK